MNYGSYAQQAMHEIINRHKRTKIKNSEQTFRIILYGQKRNLPMTCGKPWAGHTIGNPGTTSQNDKGVAGRARGAGGGADSCVRAAPRQPTRTPPPAAAHAGRALVSRQNRAWMFHILLSWPCVLPKYAEEDPEKRRAAREDQENMAIWGAARFLC